MTAEKNNQRQQFHQRRKPKKVDKMTATNARCDESLFLCYGCKTVCDRNSGGRVEGFDNRKNRIYLCRVCAQRGGDGYEVSPIERDRQTMGHNTRKVVPPNMAPET